MKKIKSILTPVLLVLILGLGACNKTGNANPAEEFAASLNELAEKAKSISNKEDFQKLQPGVKDADAIVKDNASFPLTDADKETIKEAMSNFFKVVISKSYEIECHKVSKKELNIMVSMITAGVNVAKTLGDLSKPQPQVLTEPAATVTDNDTVEVTEAAPIK